MTLVLFVVIGFCGFVLGVYIESRANRAREAWEADFHDDGCSCTPCLRHRANGGE